MNLNLIGFSLGEAESPGNEVVVVVVVVVVVFLRDCLVINLTRSPMPKKLLPKDLI